MAQVESSARSEQDFFDTFVNLPTPVQGQPTYNDLNLLRTHLYRAAAKIPSTHGGGAHGHLGLVMHPTMYATVSQTPWVTPGAPVLGNLVGLTGPAIAAEQHRYKLALRDFQEIKNLDLALTRMISKTIDPIYLGPLDEMFVGLINFTTREILEWLIKNYGRILPHQAIANRDQLSKPWSIAEPFQLLNKRFRQVAEIAHDHGTPIPDSDLIMYGLFHLQNTGVLTLPLQMWHAKPDADKDTWKKFVDHFQPEIMEYQLTKPNHNHFAAVANAETIGASIQPYLQCIEVQNNENHAALASMVSTTNTTVTQQLAALTKLVADLQLQIQQNPSITPSTASSSLSSGSRPPKRRGMVDHGSYCWTHGYWVAPNHTSATCTSPRPGHQTAATRTNPMGGSDRGKPST